MTTKKTILCLLLVGFALRGHVQLSAATPIQVKECCAPSFEFDEVAEHARSVTQRTIRDYGVTILVPPGWAKVFSIASSSEENPSSCHNHAIRIRSQISHAFIFRTPLGVSLHYWNNQSRTYRRATLSGKDVFDEVIRGATLAWIGVGSEKVSEGDVQLYVVTSETPSIETAPYVAKEFMRLLDVDSAVAYVRADGYYWPGVCYPYSFPAQWRNGDSTDIMAPRKETIYCRLGNKYKGESCV